MSSLAISHYLLYIIHGDIYHNIIVKVCLGGFLQNGSDDSFSIEKRFLLLTCLVGLLRRIQS
jgi:hypothetical protein